MANKFCMMTCLKEIPLVVDGRTLSTVIGGSCLEDLSRMLREESSLLIVYDNAVEVFAREIVSRLGRDVPSLGLSISEEEKSLSKVEEICRWLLSNEANRSSLLVAIGGGILTDMAGFAACIYKRGMRFAFVPTTLLSQVDAGIGGKTGVNFLDYKNMLGVIRQPEFTFSCPSVLRTLPYRDFLSGAAELLKTFILDRVEGERNYPRAISLLKGIRKDMAAKEPSSPMGDTIDKYSGQLVELIHSADAVKCRIVGQDQFEKGERRLLNLGHTFAHALEHEARSCGDDLSHGEAVAIGMVMAFRLSAAMGLGREDPGRIEEDFASCGLPTTCPYPLEKLLGAMTLDKKAEGGKVYFVIPRAIGDVVVEALTVEEALGNLKETL